MIIFSSFEEDREPDSCLPPNLTNIVSRRAFDLQFVHLLRLESQLPTTTAHKELQQFDRLTHYWTRVL